ncbi:hypothetical protein C2S52_020783 [Perilla frutescens var. hirtella]|nr:hypothetical protein C2S52_020783 [Perilla frutescens var. hirtella]
MSNISHTSESIAKGVGVTTRNMAKQALEASKMTIVEEEVPHLERVDTTNEGMESDFPSQTSGSLEAAVMMANDSTIEDQLANITKLIEGLHKRMQHQDDEISRLKREKGEASRANEEVNNENGDEETPANQQTNKKETFASKGFQVSDNGFIQINQLKEFIERTIKSRFDGGSKSSSAYSKPYTQRIDDLKMPSGYQPPKFTQFDRKGNPRQHIAHFIETCNNVGTYGDYLVKQFVRSLKENAFNCTRRTVSMVELTNTHRLSEISAIEMCIQGMRWGLQYILKGIQPRTFEDLATRAHDMELSMTASGIKEPPIQESRKPKERQEFKKGGKPVDKNPKKESMEVKATPQREYPFLDSDVPGIFEDLLKAKLIELPKMKRPEESGRTDEPKYCKYHRLVGHPIQDCFIFKDKVMQLSRQGKISLEEDGATTNLITLESSNMINLELGSDPHNRPLFVSGYAREQRLNRILVDRGSAVNILPLRMLNKLGISTNELLTSQLMIQGFNHEGQRALGSIRLDLLMDDMASTALFHVIDAKTSYNMLLGWPWLYENRIVPSTLHQCFKYCQGSSVKKVVGDNKPFLESESYFADAKYYLPSKKSLKATENDEVQKNEDEAPLIKEESLGKLTMPLTKIDAKKPLPPPLEGFVRPVQGSLIEHGELSEHTIPQNFGPKAFPLLLKAEYDQKVKEHLSKDKGKKEGECDATHKCSKNGGYATQNPKAGLGFTPHNPIRIAIKRANVNHISEEEARVSVFERLGNRSKNREKTPRVSVFKRLGKQLKNEPTGYRKLKTSDIEDDKESVASSFYIVGRIHDPTPQTVQSLALQEILTLIRDCIINERSGIMQLVQVMQRDGRMRTCIKFVSFEEANEEIVSSHHITLDEKTEIEEENAEEAPPQLKEGVKATVDELKEVNLGSIDDPRPTYINALLTMEEGESYVKLLREFKDVFTWSYKEMPRLDPKVAVHHLSIKKGARPVKQAQRIEIEQAKIDAILKMLEPRNIHDLKSFQGSRIMKKGVPFEWDESCRNALKSIKEYLTKAPILVAPVAGRPLILYITTQERSIGALLAQENDNGKESALYYLSRMMMPNELKYSPVEKLCLSLIFSIQKLKHYFQAHTVRLISRANPLKYVMMRPVLSDRLARWYLQFQQFEIIYVPQKAVKGQVLADFLVDHPIPVEWELDDDLPDEDVLAIEVLPPWKMYFDGASHREGAGAGVVFITPEGEVLPYSFTLTENCSNNVAEYQALILGLEMAMDAKRLQIKVYGDSKLVINQLLGSYDVKKLELIPYVKYAQRMIGWLGDVELEHVPRKENKQADALAKLASTIAMPDSKIHIPTCKSWVIPPLFESENDEEEENCAIEVFEIDKEDWRQPFVDYLKYDKLPSDPRRRVDIRRRANRFIYFKGTLYRRSFDGVFLRCLGDEEAAQAIEEAHSGICGAHQSGPKLHF